jgi:L-ascorbate metabolism protein UlaG (beta-lactamase superfamily)
MSQSHATPEEAHQIFKDLKGKTFIPMHYGTYDLSDEPLGEPIKRLTKCFENKRALLKVLKVGEKYFIKSANDNV